MLWWKSCLQFILICLWALSMWKLMLLLFNSKGMKRLEDTFNRERQAIDDLLDIAKVWGYKFLVMWHFLVRNYIAEGVVLIYFPFCRDLSCLLLQYIFCCCFYYYRFPCMQILHGWMLIAFCYVITDQWLVVIGLSWMNAVTLQSWFQVMI